MAEDRQSFSIKEDKSGTVHVAGEVVAIIAGLAATEVEGVSSMAGNITNELVSKLGMKNLSKGVKVEVTDDSVEVNLSLNIAYGYSIPSWNSIRNSILKICSLNSLLLTCLPLASSSFPIQ